VNTIRSKAGDMIATEQSARKRDDRSKTPILGAR